MNKVPTTFFWAVEWPLVTVQPGMETSYHRYAVARLKNRLTEDTRALSGEMLALWDALHLAKDTRGTSRRWAGRSLSVLGLDDARWTELCLGSARVQGALAMAHEALDGLHI